MSEVHVDRNCTKHGGLNQYCSLCLAECAEKVAIAARVPVGDEARQLAAKLARALQDYGVHKHHCTPTVSDDYCGCGLTALKQRPDVQALLGTEPPK